MLKFIADELVLLMDKYLKAKISIFDTNYENIDSEECMWLALYLSRKIM